MKPTAMRLRVDAERPAPRKLEAAVDALRRGQVIIYPTDTGYAFGCAMSSKRGIATLRRLKGIDEKHKKPLTMLVNELSDIGRYTHMSNSMFRMVRRMLPGPYTIVLRASSDVPRDMKNKANEVGIRIPDHALCHMLVDLLGEPLLTGSVTAAEETRGLPRALQGRRAPRARRGPRVARSVDGAALDRGGHDRGASPGAGRHPRRPRLSCTCGPSGPRFWILGGRWRRRGQQRERDRVEPATVRAPK